MSTIIEGVSHIDHEQLHDILNDPDSDVIVIDVREPNEYAAAHIPGVPLLPMGNIPDVIDQFDKSREYVFVCRSGARSLNVAKFCKQAGIENVHNYLGGMLAWDQEVADGEERVITQFSMDAIERNK